MEITYKIGEREYYYNPHELLCGFIFALDQLQQYGDSPYVAKEARKMLSKVRGSLLTPWEESGRQVQPSQERLEKLFNTHFKPGQTGLKIEDHEAFFNRTYACSLLVGPARFVVYDEVVVDRETKTVAVVPKEELYV
jgi:hypothetical protein